MPDLIDLLRLGFHGTALAFVYLGYQAIRDLTNRSTEGPDSEMATQRLALKLSAIQRFMVVAFVFFLFGIGSEFARGLVMKTWPYEVNLSVDPRQLPASLGEFGVPLARFEHGAEQWEFGDEPVPIQVTHQNRITVFYQDIIDKIEALDTELDMCRTNLGALTNEGGFSDADNG